MKVTVPVRRGTRKGHVQMEELTVPPQFAALGITEGESVVIPRAQHEALLAAVRHYVRADIDMDDALTRDRHMTALRAAGIDLEDKA